VTVTLDAVTDTLDVQNAMERPMLAVDVMMLNIAVNVMQPRQHATLVSMDRQLVIRV
jgi:hypothetical protein